jgi:hypothetical protein
MMQTIKRKSYHLKPFLFLLLPFIVIVYPIKTVFSTKCPKIVIKESSSGKTLTPTQMPSSSEDPEDLTEEEQSQLNAYPHLRNLSIIASVTEDSQILTTAVINTYIYFFGIF